MPDLPESELAIARLAETLDIVRMVSTTNDAYNPAALAALHWGEKAVQMLAQLTVERDWLLAEADDDTRRRFHGARKAQAAIAEEVSDVPL
jgi:alpha-D-ribose 1-methylphosphonate 5-triphosphate diphosphatase PhnM